MAHLVALGFKTAAVAAAAGAMVMLSPAVSAHAGAPADQTFKYTGTIQQTTVPDGVTSATITLSGAGGGANTSQKVSTGQAVGSQLTATVHVQPGEVITVGVGGQGGKNNGNKSPGNGGWAAAPEYEGGRGGSGHGIGANDGSGGGGASTIQADGRTIMVAGGGGGTGANGKSGVHTGGNGGTGPGDNREYPGSEGAHATKTSGSQGGSATQTTLNKTGGSSASSKDHAAGAGGGGGGYHVGEGGQQTIEGGGGGGGGSSYAASDLTAPSVRAADSSANGFATIVWSAS